MTAAVSGTTESAPTVVPDDLTPPEVDGFVARLDDGQARELLIAELESRTRPPVAEQGRPPGLMSTVQAAAGRLKIRIAEIRESLHESAAVGGTLRAWLVSEGSTFGGLWLKLLIAVALAAVFAYLTRRRLSDLDRGLASGDDQGWFTKAGYLAIQFLLALIVVVVFAAVASLAGWAMYEADDPMGEFLLLLLSIIAGVWIIRIVLRLLFDPDDVGIKIFPISGSGSRYLYLWMLITVSLYFFNGSFLGFLGEHGMPPDLVVAIRLVLGALIVILVEILILHYRQPIADAIRAEKGPGRNDITRMVLDALASIWHVLVFAYVLLIAIVWGINVILGNEEQAQAAFFSLLILLMVPVIDRLLNHLLRKVFSQPQDPEHPDAESYHIVTAFQNIVRIGLIILAVYALSEAWGFSLLPLLFSTTGSLFTGAVFNIGMTLLLSYILWEFIKLLLRRHFPNAEEQPLDALLNDESHVGKGRLESLVPLIRSTLFVVLVVMVTLVLLASIGINIGPLIAGAGVIGLAIGFGAQKLVQDVISGIFFLLDDAFRVGEYIEAGGMRGTVEKISLRSLRLRHHLGPVQTIPYSEIQAVKNNSRDYVIMKLRFRIPYDADIEKIRKTIKKVGQEMLQDPIMGPSFISPLKSQGVLQMEDSAMIMRMKFTSKPGEQFLIRREAFTRVKKALSEAGIEFAHRQVTVRVAEDATPAERQAAIAGAAGAAARAEEEATAAGKKPGGGDDVL